MSDLSVLRYITMRGSGGIYYIDNPNSIVPIETINPFYSLILKHVFHVKDNPLKYIGKTVFDDNSGYGIVHGDISYNIETETTITILSSVAHMSDHDIIALFPGLHDELVTTLDSETGPHKIDMSKIIDGMSKMRKYKREINHVVTNNGIKIMVTIIVKCFQKKYDKI
jgi:hypothetical protein